MAEESITIREKTTSSIDLQLLADGVPIDLTGVDHIRLDMIDSDGKVYRYSSNDNPSYLAIVSTSEGKIRFTPPDESVFCYKKSPYKLYVLVYTSSTQHFSVPESNKNIAKIYVEKEY